MKLLKKSILNNGLYGSFCDLVPEDIGVHKYLYSIAFSQTNTNFKYNL